MPIELPMIECSSCGKIVGHLYELYYSERKILLTEIEEGITMHEYLSNNENELMKPDKLSDYLYDNFYLKYYNYIRTLDIKKEVELSASNMIIRAVLTDYTDEVKFPINDNASDAVRYCCMRTLACDSSDMSNWES